MDWVWVQTPASGMQDVAAIAKFSNGPVVAAGSNGTVWRTVDGGTTFSPLVGSGFRRVATAPDGSSVWGVGANGTLWWTKDLAVWTQVTAADQLTDGIEDIVVDYDNWIWVTTKNGHMWSMSDGKKFVWHSAFSQFKRLAVGPGHQFWGIDRAGGLMRRDGADGSWLDTQGAGMEDVSVSVEGDVWLVDSGGFVWKTRDGQLLSRAAGGGFRSISAGPNGTIWVVGPNGTLWTTTAPSNDRVWVQTPASGMQDVAAIAKFSNGPVVAAGSNGTVWRTVDGGTTFSPLVGSGFRRVATAPDGSSVWGVGANGTLWWTKDLAVWTQVTAADQLTDGIEDIVVDYDNWIWVTTKNGHMWSMSDGKKFVWHSAFSQFKRLAVGPGHQFWGIDRAGGLMRRDGADGSWLDTQGAGMEDVSVSVEGDVWLVDSGGFVWKTRAGQLLSQTAGSGFRSISAGPNGTIWVVATDGRLWTTTPRPPAPTAKFTAWPTAGVAPLAVHFTNQSTGAVTSCQWIFNGVAQTPTSALTSPTETFTQPGQASARLDVSGPGGKSSTVAAITVVAPVPPPATGYDELLIQNCHKSHRALHIYYRVAGESEDDWAFINDSPHEADYNEAGLCPAGPNVGARFALDDGVDYEVVCVDPELPGCISGGPAELPCRRSSVFLVRGKTGGGTKTVIVN